jgi:hypothetical protein
MQRFPEKETADSTNDQRIQLLFFLILGILNEMGVEFNGD